jgi:Ca2+-binding EF-hand superfamily protein
MMRAMPLMMALDADKDGEISAAEIENASKALKALDKNGDGKLSPDELRPAMPEGAEGGPGRQVGGPGQGVDRMMAMDKNGDGKLSKDELPERMQAIFADADTDKDGFLSKAELTARMAQPGAGGPGGGRQRREGGEGRPRE